MVNLSILYVACVVGAIGVGLLLPSVRRWPAFIGAILAAGSLGAALLALLPATNRIPGDTSGPGILFYVFAFIAAAGALRMITHPRPVYAALYFILVVLASAGLFLLLSAEFMAFALVIVYAGAILITYLFVIMLAQEAPDEDQPEALANYDTQAREPVAATVVCFLLLAALLGTTYRGTATLDQINAHRHAPATQEETPHFVPDLELAILTGRVTQALRDENLIDSDEAVHWVDPATRTAQVGVPYAEDGRIVTLPPDLTVDNVDRVGLSMFNDFPVSLELAGVILLMAMLGAVVLARRALPEFNAPEPSAVGGA